MDTSVQLLEGDCKEVLATLEPESMDSGVTDPPYGISFAGKGWDHSVPGADYWSAVHRVLRPGATLLAFGGTRTFHRLACAIEDGGFSIRDCIARWVAEDDLVSAFIGTLSKDQIAAFEHAFPDGPLAWMYSKGYPRKQCLKPAWEPIVIARKMPRQGEPRSHGLNVDACRISDAARVGLREAFATEGEGELHPRAVFGGRGGDIRGRWPANVMIEHRPECGERCVEGCPCLELDRQARAPVSRFFYSGKASREDRGEGNTHPTVKPRHLMQYLVRLVTPPGGRVLDPFMGSGSTGVAAAIEGFAFTGIDRESRYVRLARYRIANARMELLNDPMVKVRRKR